MPRIRDRTTSEPDYSWIVPENLTNRLWEIFLFPIDEVCGCDRHTVEALVDKFHKTRYVSNRVLIYGSVSVTTMSEIHEVHDLLRRGYKSDSGTSGQDCQETVDIYKEKGIRHKS